MTAQQGTAGDGDAERPGAGRDAQAADASAEHPRRPGLLQAARRVLRTTGILVLPAAAYITLGVLRVWPAWRAPTRLAQCGCGDAAFVMWFLGWTPFAAAHGHGLFFTDWLFHPAGVNTLWNISLPLPGLLAGPITQHWGVVVTYDILVVVGFAGSALSAYLVLRRWVRWPPAAFAGGLLYGYSPYMIGQGIGHLHMVLMLLVPPALLLLDDILVRQRLPSWLAGLLLGGVLAAQLLTAEEVLASMTVVGLIGLAVLVAIFPRQILPRLRRGALGLAVGGGTALALSAWPLAQQFAGRQRLHGRVSDPDRYRADLLSWVVPARIVRYAPASALRVSRDFTGNLAENGSYLGIPLLAIALVTAVVLWRRRRMVRWAAVTLVLVMAFASGPSLHIRGTDTGVWMPLATVRHVPLLQSIVGVRLAVYAVLLAALLLAVGADALHQTVRSGLAGVRRLPPGVGPAVAVVPPAVLLAVALLPLLPRSYHYPVTDTKVPAWFTSASALQRVPTGSVVVTVPWPSAQNAAPMLWQAEAGFRFKTPFGYALHPQPDGRGTFNPQPSELLHALDRFRWGSPPRVDAGLIRQMRSDLASWDARSVVAVEQTNQHLAEQVDLLTRVIGRPPVHDTGAWAWYDIDPRRLAGLPVHPAPWPPRPVGLPTG